MSTARLAADRQQASDWLRRGQAFEAQGSPDTLAQALVCYEQVIALLESIPAHGAARELGIAHMNRGNVLQKQNRGDEAVRAYDAAIGCLQPLATAGDQPAINSVGAAWMNRGHALQLTGSPAALAEALRSHDEAIALLSKLPLAEHAAYRANLAGAWLNRAQVLLADARPDFPEARAALATALGVAQPAERVDPLAAEISLKLRHALCAALTRQLAAGPAGLQAQLIAETGDTIDEAMELIRHWEQGRTRSFRPLAGVLYRFGAQFYLAHQPQFLAEFLLESLDPARAPGAMPTAAELHAVAAEAIARALSDNYNRRLADPSGAAAERLQEVAQTLTAAESRRAELQRGHPPLSNSLPS
jgi:tetratricopeptide (TPR) repeat protein